MAKQKQKTTTSYTQNGKNITKTIDAKTKKTVDSAFKSDMSKLKSSQQKAQKTFGGMWSGKKKP